MESKHFYLWPLWPMGRRLFGAPSSGLPLLARVRDAASLAGDYLNRWLRFKSS